MGRKLKGRAVGIQPKPKQSRTKRLSENSLKRLLMPSTDAGPAAFESL